MSDAQDFSHVMDAELDHVRVSRGRRKVTAPVCDGADICNRALDSELLGVAISGGGIRSATLALGVLQALANRKLIREVDYLSTVSGGGYIGSWLISRFKRLGGPEQVGAVEQMLSSDHTCHPENDDQMAIHFLRQNSNYLTPRLGLFSADVWTMVVIWFRNTLLNLTLQIAAFGVIILAARFLGLAYVAHCAPRLPLLLGAPWRRFLDCAPWLNLDELLTILFFLGGACALGWGLRPASKWTQKKVLLRIVLPFVLGSMFLSRALSPPSWLCSPSWYCMESCWLSPLFEGIGFTVLFVVLTGVSFLGGTYRRVYRYRSRAYRIVTAMLSAATIGALAILVPSLVVVLGLQGIAKLLATSQYPIMGPWLMWTLGPPGILALLALGVTLHIGILGMIMDLREREWLSRLGAWAIIMSFGWISIVGAAVCGPWLLMALVSTQPWTKFGLTAGWLAATLAGVLSGNSAKTSGEGASSGAASAGGKASLELIARVAPFVFLPGFALLIALGVHALTAPGGLNVPPSPKPSSVKLNFTADSGRESVQVSATASSAATNSPWIDDPEAAYFGRLVPHLYDTNVILSPAALLGILSLVAGLLTWRLDINIFSLHEFYKNRLVRCYLGATRDPGTRKPDKFTAFDKNDDMPLGDFNARKGYYGPYPLLNATMNVSSGEDLAWQERKSVAFLFSPLFCGYDVGQGNEKARLGLSTTNENSSDNAYRDTAELCYGTGIDLGTAMAVSGAAASPNQGYNTSTPIAFMMTVFDARLGLWLGNPRRDDQFFKFSPEFNLLTMAEELFGLTNAETGYVNLSDGGHFDNMGLYELVRRRCRYIILSDGEQDADLTFGSLTTTIRNCRTDFGVEINISLDRIAKNEKGFSTAHCVVGSIQYPEDSGRKKEETRPGYLLYLKSSLTGDEPADVTGYRAAGHPEFPHQSTGDQWFTEAQFEAYRKLGEHIVETAIGSVRTDPADRENFFKELQNLWYPPSSNVERHSARHAELFTDLVLPFGEEDRLAHMDPQLFTAWTDRTTRLDRWERESVYRVSALIQLMQTIYTDLNLESKGEMEHPHNQGWLRIFEHWVQQPGFKETWARTKNMYSDRFQAFYEDRVNA